MAQSSPIPSVTVWLREVPVENVRRICSINASSPRGLCAWRGILKENSVQAKWGGKFKKLAMRKLLQLQTLSGGNWLHGNPPFVTLDRTLKRVCDSEMPISEFDLLAGIVGC